VVARRAAARPVVPGIGLSQFQEYAASALRATTANKVRAALSMLGILIGVAAVITMLALGNGAQKAVEANLAGLGSNLLTVRPVGHMSAGGVRGAAGDVSRLTFDDVKAVSEIPHVLRAEGNVQGSAQVVYGSKNTSTSIYGVTTAYTPMHNAKPKYGRFFTDAEDEERARVAVIGQTVINNIFGDEDPVDKVIKINHVSYAVIGVLPLKGSSGPFDQDDKVVIPLNTAMKRALGQNYLGSIVVECDGPDSTNTVQEAIQKLMRERHRVPDYKDDDVDIMNMSEIKQALSRHHQDLHYAAGYRGRDLPAGRRHRHHEHHAGLRWRADSRDRAAQGRGRPSPGHPGAVPHRSGPALDDGRGHRHPDRRQRLVGAIQARWMGRHHHSARDRDIVHLLRECGDNLRLLAGTQGLPALSH